MKLNRCPVCGGKAVLVSECYGIRYELVYYVTCRGDHAKSIHLCSDPHRAADEWNEWSEEYESDESEDEGV